MEIARQYHFLPGAQLPRTIYDVHLPLYFADQDFKRPRYVRYIQALRKYRPVMASVLDIMEWRRLDEYLMRAEEISQYCDKVMLIPKVPGIIKHLPIRVNNKPIILGYSVNTSFGKTDVSIGEFGDRPTHLLGGSPIAQFDKARKMNIVSADGNYHQMMSNRCQFFYPESLWTSEYRQKTEAKPRTIKNPIWPTILEYDEKLWGDGSNKAEAPYEAFRRSCENIMAMWKGTSPISEEM